VLKVFVACRRRDHNLGSVPNALFGMQRSYNEKASRENKCMESWSRFIGVVATS
jgi:hypothetical protein